METVRGRPSFRISSTNLEAWITQTGGHLGPVKVQLGHRVVEPFSVAPWAEEEIDANAMIRTLRGDFFCLPFGGNETSHDGKQHPQHGDTANLAWCVEEQTHSEIRLSLELGSIPGRVEKTVRLDGTTIYQTHRIIGVPCPLPGGHHAMLKFPSEGRYSTSEFVHGRVFPGTFESPAQGGYTSLLPGAQFYDLEQVPMATGEPADLTRYPAREGYEDLVQLYHRQGHPFAWNAVVVDGYIWFALKDPNLLNSTILWHSNGGRHYAPWSGRHRGVLGVEDVCGYFHYGAAESSAPNQAPVPTCLPLSSDSPTDVRYLMSFIEAPLGFDRVSAIEPTSDGVRLVSESGQAIDASVNWQFLFKTS